MNDRSPAQEQYNKALREINERQSRAQRLRRLSCEMAEAIVAISQWLDERREGGREAMLSEVAQVQVVLDSLFARTEAPGGLRCAYADERDRLVCRVREGTLFEGRCT